MAGTSVLQIERSYGHMLPNAIERGRGALDAFDARSNLSCCLHLTHQNDHLRGAINSCFFVVTPTTCQPSAPSSSSSFSTCLPVSMTLLLVPRQQRCSEGLKRGRHSEPPPFDVKYPACGGVLRHPRFPRTKMRLSHRLTRHLDLTCGVERATRIVRPADDHSLRGKRLVWATIGQRRLAARRNRFDEKPRTLRGFSRSGRRDLNSGPLVPQTSALTRLRHAPSGSHSSSPPG